jgi:hypothetical protein
MKGNNMPEEKNETTEPEKIAMPEKITFQCWNCRCEIEGLPSETTTNVFCEVCGARQ